MRRLTAVQVRLVQFIGESIELHGYAPSFREIMDRFGWSSTNNVAEHLLRCQRKGLLRQAMMKSRAIGLTEEGWAIASGWKRGRIPVVTSSLAATGYVDPPSMRCERCARVFFGESHRGHVCSAEDLAVAS